MRRPLTVSTLTLALLVTTHAAAPQTLAGRDAQLAGQPGTQALGTPGPRPTEPQDYEVLTPPQARARAAALRDPGGRLFAAPRRSASGQLACASCHDPARAFSPSDAGPAQIGGVHMDQ